MTTEDMVDKLGKVKAKLAKYAAEELALVTSLKTKGVGIKGGKLFEANVFLQGRSHTDWDKVCKEARVAARTIAKYTESKSILVCTVTAKKVRRTRRATRDLRVS